MLSSRVTRKISEIPQGEWESVFPRVPDGYCFFKSIDESAFKQFSFRYILVHDNERIVGAAPCFVMDYPLETSTSGPVRRSFGFLRKLIPRIFTVKSVISGVPMGQGNIGLSAGLSGEVVREVSACLERIAQEENAAVVAFKDFGYACREMLGPLLLKPRNEIRFKAEVQKVRRPREDRDGNGKRTLAGGS